MSLRLDLPVVLARGGLILLAALSAMAFVAVAAWVLAPLTLGAAAKAMKATHGVSRHDVSEQLPQALVKLDVLGGSAFALAVEPRNTRNLE